MITLVLGGTRSGKSDVAERLAAAAGGPVTYVATAVVDPSDRDHVARIERHRQRRPATWTTIECVGVDELPTAVASTAGTVLVDSLGTWVSGAPDLVVPVDALLEALTARADDVVVVSEEVGMSLHAPTELGRRFVDELGRLNQAVAAVADRAVLVVAGRVLELRSEPMAGDDLDSQGRPC